MNCNLPKGLSLAQCAAGQRMVIVDLMMMLFFAIKVPAMDHHQIYI